MPSDNYIFGQALGRTDGRLERKRKTKAELARHGSFTKGAIDQMARGYAAGYKQGSAERKKLNPSRLASKSPADLREIRELALRAAASSDWTMAARRRLREMAKRVDRELAKRAKNPAKRGRQRKAVPKKVVETYRRLLGGTISPAAMKLIRKEYKVNPGGAFERCVAEMSKRPGVYSPRGLCATIGRDKYGAAEMKQMAAAGRRRASRTKRNAGRGLADLRADWHASERARYDAVKAYDRERTPANYRVLTRARKKEMGAAAKFYKAAQSASRRHNVALPARLSELRRKADEASAAHDRAARDAAGAGRGHFSGPLRATRKKELAAHQRYTKAVAAWQKKLARKNPGSEDEAAELYRDFHGHDPKVTIDVVTPVKTHTVLSGLGILKSLVIRSAAKPLDITLSGFRGAVLARPPHKRDKPQLYIEGGDQAVNLADFGITDPHEVETLGEVRDIVYHTDKTHLAPEDGGKADYEHSFRTGRNGGGKHIRFRNGRYPTAIYDVRNRLITLAGGTYDIPAEGING